MRERIFNVFLYVDHASGLIQELGIVVHERAGTDAEKLAYLQEKARVDYRIARRFRLPKGCILANPDGSKTERAFSYQGFAALQQVGQHTHVFEEMFVKVGAPQDPLTVITPIVDGVPRIDGVIGINSREDQ